MIVDVKVDRGAPASREFMVVSVTGRSDAGVEFVDAFVPASRREIHVVDAGVIVIHEGDLDDLVARAADANLQVSVST